MDHTEALAALAAKQNAETQLAKAANCPPWRHVIFGVMMGAIIASFAFDIVARAAVLIAALALVPVIVQSDRKRMGMFINGYRRGKTRLVTFGILFVWMILYAVAVYYSFSQYNRTIPLVLGAAAFVVCTAGSVVWQSVFVREMES